MILCLSACAQKQQDQTGNDRGHRGPGGMVEMNKDNDSVFVALKNETLDKFKQFTFEDAETGGKLEYNLCIPDGYDESQSYPLVLFMADASTAGKEVTTPLTQVMARWNLPATVTKTSIRLSCLCHSTPIGLCKTTGARRPKWR